MGSILERFGGPKSSQNRSKIGLKSDHEANAKILKIISRGGVFEDAENRKAIKNQQKNRLKSDLKLRCQKNTQKCTKKWPTWLQHGFKLGPCWGPETVLGPPKRTPASTPRTTPTFLDFRPPGPRRRTNAPTSKPLSGHI